MAAAGACIVRDGMAEDEYRSLRARFSEASYQAIKAALRRHGVSFSGYNEAVGRRLARGEAVPSLDDPELIEEARRVDEERRARKREEG